MSVKLFGLYLLVFGSRLLLINLCGSDLPYWDQWYAEADQIYIPWLDGNLSWRNFLPPHNEHRIVLTRIYAFLIFIINGQWDVKIQMIINAAIYSFLPLMLYRFMLPGEKHKSLWMTIIAILFTLPFGWQNTLAGFQIQFYLMAIATVLTIRLFLSSKTFSFGWWCAASTALLSLFTMASGFFGALSVAMLLLYESSKLNRLKEYLPSILMTVGVAIAGIVLKVDVPYHQNLKAGTFTDFFIAFMKYLAWPIPLVPFWGFIQWVPFFLLLFKYVTLQNQSLQMKTAVALGFAILMQCAAMGYSRVDFIVPAPRYQDLLSLGTIANCHAAVYLFSDKTSSIKMRILLISWGAATILGLSAYTYLNLTSHLPAKIVAQREMTRNLKSKIAVGHPEKITGIPNFTLPEPDAAHLGKVLSHTKIVGILPESIVPGNGSGRLKLFFSLVERAYMIFILTGGYLLFKNIKTKTAI